MSTSNLRFRINLLDGHWTPISGHWSVDAIADAWDHRMKGDLRPED